MEQAVQAVEAAVERLPHAAVVVAGRTFRQSTTTTIAQDAYVMKRYRASGLADMARAFDPATDDLNALSERLLWEAFETGILYELLGGMLTEEGTPWSRESAERNAQFFSRLTDAADKQTVYERIGDILHDFLVVAAVSNATSPNSLGRGQPTNATPLTSEPPSERRIDEPLAGAAPPSETATALANELASV